MSYIEKNIEILKTKIIPQTKKEDFDAFWKNEVEMLRKIPLEITRKELDLPYKSFTSYEITFNTHDDTIVSAYFSVPKNADGPLPCVAYFTGGGGKKAVVPHIVSTGVCCLFMDVRSQGGTTFDKAQYKMGDDYRGALMTHDVLYKESFYMKNIYLDAVRAIDTIASLPEVDAEKIVTYGGSQGGALSIASAALSNKVLKAYPAVPSFCCLVGRVEAGSGVFSATKKYLLDHPENTDIVFDTLSYFDINNMVSLLKTPVDFALGMIDEICIPEFVYSPYHHTTAPKQLFMYPFTPHCIPKSFELHALTEFSKL